MAGGIGSAADYAANIGVSSASDVATSIPIPNPFDVYEIATGGAVTKAAASLALIAPFTGPAAPFVAAAAALMELGQFLADAFSGLPANVKTQGIADIFLKSKSQITREVGLYILTNIVGQGYELSSGVQYGANLPSFMSLVQALSGIPMSADGKPYVAHIRVAGAQTPVAVAIPGYYEALAAWQNPTWGDALVTVPRADNPALMRTVKRPGISRILGAGPRTGTIDIGQWEIMRLAAIAGNFGKEIPILLMQPRGQALSRMILQIAQHGDAATFDGRSLEILTKAQDIPSQYLTPQYQKGFFKNGDTNKIDTSHICDCVGCAANNYVSQNDGGNTSTDGGNSSIGSTQHVAGYLTDPNAYVPPLGGTGSGGQNQADTITFDPVINVGNAPPSANGGTGAATGLLDSPVAMLAVGAVAALIITLIARKGAK